LKRAQAVFLALSSISICENRRARRGAAGPKGSDGSSGCGVCIGLCIAIMAQ
jgi:hypothetical protein